MKKQYYQLAQADHTLFYKHSTSGNITILIVYVNDIILTDKDQVEMERLKKSLAEEFEIKDLGNLKYLGMEVARSKVGISVSQKNYTLDLLKETRMLGCGLVDTPMDANFKLGNGEDSTIVATGNYQRLVGILIYLSHTRPNIAFAISVVTQHAFS